MRPRGIVACLLLVAVLPGFDYHRELFEAPSTLAVHVQSIDRQTGVVVVNGGDSQCPTIPFTWNWGDGSPPEEGWFPGSHTYTDLGRSYLIGVTSHYGGGATDSTTTLARFVAPLIDPIALPADLAVTIPDHEVTLISRMPGYGIPPGLSFFGDEFFDFIPRSAAEYVLSAGAAIQYDLASDDVVQVGGGFEQVILRYASFPGMASLWYTEPVAIGSGDYGLEEPLQYSSYLHEQGHNVTLNSPADYCYGGKIDGNANAIFSESMAQIFQHATAYQLVNDAAGYGIEAELAFEIGQSARSSVNIVRQAFDDYVATGMPFASWNDPATPEDETFDTFMTIAYQFLAEGETAGVGYQAPLQGMMRLLQGFRPSWHDRWDQQHSSAEADTFRATLMVTAMSAGYDTDLRQCFRDLQFPISDAIYEELMATIGIGESRHATSTRPRLQLVRSYPNPFNPSTTIDYTLTQPCAVTLCIRDAAGRLVRVLVEREAQLAGRYRVRWDGTDAATRAVASGVYFFTLEAGPAVRTGRLVLVK